jgi:hypothetical protein
MNTCARSRILSHIILTVFFCALAVAATTRPLSRTRLGRAPQLNQVHQGLERHTFFEVSAGSPHAQALYDLLIRSGVSLMAAAQAQSFRVVSARQPDNWPIAFSPVYRHIPPSKFGDSDLSA